MIKQQTFYNSFASNSKDGIQKSEKSAEVFAVLSFFKHLGI